MLHLNISNKKKKCGLLALPAIVLAVSILAFNHAPSAKADESGSIVGAWQVDAVGAPFRPHVAAFHSDQTMEIDNPESGDSHTSDRMGFGPWAATQDGNGNVIGGKFVEINADRTTNQFVSKLVVTYHVRVAGNSFTGPAEATYYNPDGTLQ